LAARPAGRIIEEIGVLSAEVLTHKLLALLEMCWRKKVHFARLCSQRLGWTAACHQTEFRLSFSSRANVATGGSVSLGCVLGLRERGNVAGG
jgi:hypothetical protein